MSFRPLILFFGLTLGDYLLWNWSLNGNHDVLALVSGLTLPPLSVAFLWLLVTGLARLLARSTRQPRRRASAARAQARHTDDAPSTSAQASAESRRLAA